MMYHEKIRSTYLLYIFISLAKAKLDVYTASVGGDIVLPCIHSIVNFTMITWTVNLRNQSSCFLSILGKVTEGNCPRLLHLDIDKNQTSLRIQNIVVLDDGNYTCQVVNESGTFMNTVALRVLAQPFVAMRIDDNEHPECRAIGGKPAANISWIPMSTDGVVTQIDTEQNGTMTVISSYNTSKATEVTCIVSHPTFTSPMERRLQAHYYATGENNIYLILGVVTVSVLILGLALYWKRSNIRICLSAKKDEPVTRDNPVMVVDEVEPYASFTETVNTIYSSVNDLPEYKGTNSRGQKTLPK